MMKAPRPSEIRNKPLFVCAAKKRTRTSAAKKRTRTMRIYRVCCNQYGIFSLQSVDHPDGPRITVINWGEWRPAEAPGWFVVNGEG